MGLDRRKVAGAFLDPERLKQLVAVAFGTTITVVAEENQVAEAAQKKPTVTWGTGYVVIQGAKSRELVSSLIKRAGFSYKRVPFDKDYVLEVKQKRGGRFLQSQYWLADSNGEYSPPDGTPCLLLELGHWDGNNWTLVERPEWPILKMRVPLGLDVRLVQEGFGANPVAYSLLDVFHVGWVSGRRKLVARTRRLLLPFA